MSKKNKILLLIIGGVLVGFTNGFLGGGGGMLVVPLLLWLCALPQKNAHATALMIILPVSIVSAAVYLINGSGDWHKILFATIGVVGGGLLGALLLNKLKSNFIKFIFSFIMIAAGIRMFL